MYLLYISKKFLPPFFCNLPRELIICKKFPRDVSTFFHLLLEPLRSFCVQDPVQIWVY